MSARAKRQDAGAAVGGLFDRATATGGLAGRAAPPPGQPTSTPDPAQTVRAAREASPPAGDGRRGRGAPEPRVRLGVELTESEVAFLRGLSRPARTGGPRTLGAKLVATGVLAAAIELLADVDVDMHGVRAGDLADMTERARVALRRAGTPDEPRKDGS